ncbi:MAG: radical SAM family heme chaperone HemW [Anaerococcus sp.]|nr:radical SAM family heme chaperone HemW [Anaerococcus sp.]
MEKVGCYVHIPFCEKKCYYCDFTAFMGLDKYIDSYVDNLIKEISLYKERLDLSIDSLYIGGGTPSYIDPQYIRKIVKELQKFDYAPREFTIEANPNSLNEDKLKIYEDLGVTRISLGVQSFDDRVLENIGRNHNKDIALRDIDMIKKYDFDLSFDLMLNLPCQDFASIKNDLAMVKRLAPDHISWYSLILDRGSRFYALDQEGRLELMDDDREVDIFSYIIGDLEKMDLNRYEISNFAKLGHESIHNKKYWDNEGYLGVGLGASGFLSNIRYTNTKNFVKYDQAIRKNRLPIVTREFISKDEREKEYIIFKLRESEGFSLEEFKEKFGEDFLEKYKKEIAKFNPYGYFKIGDNFAFTEKGMSLSNEFFVEII